MTKGFLIEIPLSSQIIEVEVIQYLRNSFRNSLILQSYAISLQLLEVGYFHSNPASGKTHGRSSSSSHGHTIHAAYTPRT